MHCADADSSSEPLRLLDARFPIEAWQRSHDNAQVMHDCSGTTVGHTSTHDGREAAILQRRLDD
jgi:hypothetical protein